MVSFFLFNDYFVVEYIYFIGEIKFFCLVGGNFNGGGGLFG